MPSNDCDFMSVIGEFGAYQKWLVVSMMPACFLLAFIYFGQIFMVLVPRDYWCRIKELESWPKEKQLALAIPKLKDGDFDRCSMYKIETSWNDVNVSRANDSWPKVPCNDGWIYDRALVPYPTIATENNWVCDRLGLGTISLTVYFVASLVGCLLFGYIADHCGRVWSFFLANLSAVVGGVLTALSNEFYFFTASRFVTGLSLNYCFTSIYILTIENVGIRYRTLVGNAALTFAFPFGGAVMPWIAIWCNHWRIFDIAITAPIVLLIAMAPCLPESPTWLLSVGKIDKGMQVLRRAAKISGKNISDEVWAGVRRCYAQQHADQQTEETHSFLEFFKRFRRFCVLAILSFFWLIGALIYDVCSRSIFLLPHDSFIIFSLSMLTEVPGGVVPLLLVDRLGRKPMVVVSLSVCALSSFIAVVVQGKWVAPTTAIINRFAVTIVFNVGEQWVAEILPTVVRGQGMAVINLCGCTGSLLGPSIVYGENLFLQFPMLTVAILSVIGGLIVLVLPETMDVVLPHTLEDADELWTLRCGVK